MGISACILNSSIVSILGVRFEFLFCHSLCQPEVQQVCLILCPFLYAHENVWAFEIGVYVATTMDVLYYIQLEKNYSLDIGPTLYYVRHIL